MAISAKTVPPLFVQTEVSVLILKMDHGVIVQRTGLDLPASRETTASMTRVVLWRFVSTHAQPTLASITLVLALPVKIMASVTRLGRATFAIVHTVGWALLVQREISVPLRVVITMEHVQIRTILLYVNARTNGMVKSARTSTIAIRPPV